MGRAQTRCTREPERNAPGTEQVAAGAGGDSASALPELEGLAEEKRYGLNASLGWLQDATGDKFVCTTR